MPANLYSFFFTHLTQSYSPTTGVSLWLDVLPPAENTQLPETREQNNVSVKVSARQAQGTLTLLVPNGQTLLDASASIPVDTSLTSDTTVQPVRQFQDTLTTPLQPPLLTRQFTYVHNNLTVQQQFPLEQVVNYAIGLYPNQVLQNIVYHQIPWFVHPFDFQVPVRDSQAEVYQLLTVDSTQILSNTSDITQALNGTLTTDKTSLYFPAANSQFVLDASPDLQGDQLLTIEGVPAGNAIVDWMVGSTLTSSVWFPGAGRGYLPANQLGANMSGVFLHELALSLVTLSHQGNEDLVLSLCQELVYLQTQTSNLLGLPSFLPREVRSQIPLELQRDTFEQAWLGYALVYAVRRLRDRPLYTRREPAQGTASVLASLAQSVASAVDGSGYASQGFDSSGKRLEVIDYAGMVMAQLFLTDYLVLQYDAFVHQQAALLTKALADFDDLSQVAYQDLNRLPVLYGLLSNVLKQEHVTTSALVNLVAQALSDQPISTFTQGLWAFVQQQLIFEGYFYPNINSPLAPVSSFFTEVTPGLFLATPSFNPGTDQTPTLVESSWGALLQLHLLDPTILRPQLGFDLYAFASRAFLTLGYQEAKRLWPFGYMWTDPEAEQAFTGRLGALLYMQALPLFAWCLQFMLLTAGLTLNTAQGWALDTWGDTLKQPRPLLQSDPYYRQSLLVLLTREQSTLSSLRSRLQALYGVDILLTEPTLLNYTQAGEQLPWTDDPHILNTLADATLVTIPREPYPSPALVSLGTTKQVTLDQALASLVLLTYSYLPGLEAVLKDNTSAAIYTSSTTVYLDSLQYQTFLTSS